MCLVLSYHSDSNLLLSENASLSAGFQGLTSVPLFCFIFSYLTFYYVHLLNFYLLTRIQAPLAQGGSLFSSPSHLQHLEQYLASGKQVFTERIDEYVYEHEERDFRPKAYYEQCHGNKKASLGEDHIWLKGARRGVARDGSRKGGTSLDMESPKQFTWALGNGKPQKIFLGGLHI